MRKGDLIQCRRDAPAKGSWKEFDGRVGIVVESNMGEVGVRFEPDGPIYWFERTELRYYTEPQGERRS